MGKFLGLIEWDNGLVSGLRNCNYDWGKLNGVLWFTAIGLPPDFHWYFGPDVTMMEKQ